MHKTVIAAGHICLDITPELNNSPASRISDILKPGTALESGKAHISLGGSVANTGLAMKLLGADVVLMGKIGKDTFGSIVKERLERYVPTDHMIETEGENTSYSIVLAPRGIDRIFLHCTGANDTFSSEDPDYSVIEKADMFHFGYPPHMRNMFLNDGRELVSIMSKVDALGVVTSLDMASVDDNSASGKADWEKILKMTLPHTDFFVPSAEELAYMADRTLYSQWTRRADGRDRTEFLTEDEVRGLAERMLSWGAKVVLIKCGKAGLCLACGGAEEMKALGAKTGMDMSEWADVRHFEKSFRPLKMLSATGAGDTAIAAFLCCVMSGYSWRKCVQLAAAEGASCLEAYDAISGLRGLRELEDMIEDGWGKL
ncbi:MAG: carbohydrate kinase family protein [Lachnospiraceae bacterium]|nr:carbohydrate kinase family protein [Lachnospiraceae bacterium]